jgi:hypothetical protein
MSDLPAEYLNLAARLLDQETTAGETLAQLADAAERVFLRLYDRLANSIGTEGFCVLVRRAQQLVQDTYSFFRAVKMEATAEHCLQGLSESIHGQDFSVARRGIEYFVANFIWLLATFIGKDLALRFIARGWPQLFPKGVE